MNPTQDQLQLIEVAITKRKFWLKMFFISLVGVVLPPIIAVAISMFTMNQAFTALGTSGADVGALAENISGTLVSTAIAICFSGVAFILLMISLVRFLMIPKVINPAAL